MVFDFLNNPTNRILERGMAASMVRNQNIMQNIANVNTPGYKRSDVDFATVMEQTMSGSELPLATTHPKHMTGTLGSTNPIRVVKDQSTSSRADGNNVDIEYEMSQLTENSLYYQTMTNFWKRKASGLKAVIQGRV